MSRILEILILSWIFFFFGGVKGCSWELKECLKGVTFNGTIFILNPAFASKLSVVPDKGTKSICSMFNCFFGLSVLHGGKHSVTD